MKSRTSLIAVLFATIPLMIFVLIAAGCRAPETSTATAPASVMADGPAEMAGESTEATAATGTQVATEQDGKTLLQSYCAPCHSVTLLEKTRKTRAEWEKTLSRMERHSGPLNDSERLLILDHLVIADRP